MNRKFLFATVKSALSSLLFRFEVISQNVTNVFNGDQMPLRVLHKSITISSIVLLLNVGLYAQVKILLVDPGKSDPAIETVHGPNIALYDPGVPSNYLLYFYITGTGGSAIGSERMDSIMATWGYHAISIDYENNVIAVACAHSLDSTSFGRYRDAIVTGAPVSDKIKVDTANSILNRFQKLLVYLVKHDPQGNWGEFVRDGQPVWDRIIVAGHSQGAGHAPYIAKLFKVNRVLMFSGPQDYMDDLHRPAPWQRMKSATPPSRFFAFLARKDPFNVHHQIANCMMLMDLLTPDTLIVQPGETITGHHQILINDIPTKWPHASTLFPEFENVWKCMLRANDEGNKMKLNLMPWPAEIKLTGGKYRLDRDFTVQVTGNPSNRLYVAVSRMLRRISERTGLFFSQDYLSRDSVVRNPGMVIHADRPGKLGLHEDESYKLEVTPSRIQLTANTGIGALRGLQTFLQLLEADSSGYYFPTVNIVDHPRFPWRGLLIDAARHFMPVDVIERNIRGMAAVKLNVLHWHLSDNQGFRAESKTFPKLTGMGSDGLYYSQAQIKEVVEYAADRGIRVVPEFDLPAHSTSWFVGYPQYASAPGPYTIERKFGVFDPVFDPTTNRTYKFLDRFFKEMCALFPDQYIHIGGDENDGVQWNANPKIQKFMKTHRISNDQSLQTYFENRLIGIIGKYHKEVIGWDEILNPHLQKSAIIQSWRGKASMVQAASQGYRVILSDGYYVDHYFPAGTCYLDDPIPDNSGLTAEQKKLIIGGEACMWSEFVSPENVDSRIWPRTAAIAERLWSPEDVRNVKDMYRRLGAVSLELDGLGLNQISNQEMMERRLVNGYDTKPLENFINVVEPVELYDRASTGKYTSFSPSSRVVDTSAPDPEVARRFTDLVDELISENKSEGDTIEILRQRLMIWKDNDTKLEQIIRRSPILKEIEPLSKELSGVAVVALEALNYIEKGTKPDRAWENASLSKIEEASLPVGEVKLIIIPAIRELVKRSAGEKMQTSEQ